MKRNKKNKMNRRIVKNAMQASTMLEEQLCLSAQTLEFFGAMLEDERAKDMSTDEAYAMMVRVKYEANQLGELITKQDELDSIIYGK